MDQVKVYLRLLKKHHFWVLCSIAAIIGFLCWWSGTNSVANETKSNEGIVKGSDSALSGVDKESRPPNGSFSAGVAARDDELKQKVLAEWKQRYDEQQKLFSWPADVAEDMARLKPDSPIGDTVRRLYKNLVFPKVLVDKVFLTADYRRPVEVPSEEEPATEGEAKPAADAAPGRSLAAAATSGPTIEMEGLVVWNPAHRAALEQRYNFKANPATPTTMSIRLAQEDVWMLENLAKVIRQTNEGALDIIAVPIKRIDTLEIAQWAINDAVAGSPRVFVEKTDGGGTSAAGMGAASLSAGGTAGPEVAADASQEEKEKASDEELLNGRYIGDTGVPLTAAEQPYAEFRLMFVRMRVVIDQRKIPQLLVNCANAPIPIEVVRCTMFDPLVSSGGTPGASPAAGGGLRGMGGGGAGPQPAQQNAGGGKNDDIEPNPQDVTFEVCGLVQLYNPPDETKLGTGTAADPGKRPNGVPTAGVKTPRNFIGSTTGGAGGLR
ncbi:MAG TPA: hypothetical protein VGG64_30410 [Pirellulales bacterium]|jgi:hypothetical protein